MRVGVTIEPLQAEPGGQHQVALRAGRSRRRARVLLIGLYGVALGIALQLLWTVLVAQYGAGGRDYDNGIRGVHAASQAKPLYDVGWITADLFGAPFHLPPLAALIPMPLILPGRNPGLEVWRALSLAAHFGALAVLLRALGVPRASMLTPLALAVWGVLWPVRTSLYEGQWDAFFLLAVAAAWWAAARQRGLLAGAILALAGNVKPYPLLALGYFVARRRWGTVSAGLLGCGLVFAGAGLAVGLDETLVFLQAVMPQLGGTTGYSQNQSFAGFLVRLVDRDLRPIVSHTPLVYLLSRAFTLGSLLLLGLMTSRTPRSPSGAALQYAGWVAGMPIVIPVAWDHYQVLLALPLVVLAWAWWSGAPRPTRFEGALFMAALVLIAFGDHTTVLGPGAAELWQPKVRDAMNETLRARFAGPLMLLLSYKLYGALLLWGLCLRAAWQTSGPADRSVPPAWPAGAGAPGEVVSQLWPRS